ncbi:MAG TPA: D-Ala-D-Ala carboxypeptidase family metallohydrolase [Candidatus Elarobacter sp.]|jgi:putative chitinase|nr:D-Ala-D-Ala carboxypeptidase family metallohydrolase [Candidatus Elarobacter sp.]
MQLSPNFTLEELTVTNTGLANTPTAAEIEVLRTLAAFMEKVRTALNGRPISVNSAFRSAAVNAAVGGVPNSAHRLGFAVDFVCPQFGTPYQICLALDAAEKAGKIKFDQLIQEGTWTHISRDPQLRGQRLTLIGPGQYAAGIQPTNG